MIAIENSGLLNLSHSCINAGFVPSLGYTFDPTAKTVKIDNKSTYPAGDSLLVVNISVHDRQGKQVDAQINSTETSKTIDVSKLLLSDKVNITATIVTKARVKQDLAIYDLGGIPNSGTIGAEVQDESGE